MNVLDVYTKVLDRLNRGNTNTGQDVSKRQFVFAFNKMQLHWLGSKIKMAGLNKSVEDDLGTFIEEYCTTPSQGKNPDYCYINLPENYFNYNRVEGLVCGSCKHSVHGFPRSEESVGRLLLDRFQNPSLEWQETFYTVGDNKLKFYTAKKFKCKQILLVYYRCPVEIDCEGIKYSDRIGINIDPELTKLELEEVIDLTVRLLSGDYGDQQTYGVTQNRIING